MKDSILSRKIVLAVDDEPDFLTNLEKEILHAYPNCHFDKVTTYQQAREMIFIWTYDLIILNVTIPRGFDLLEHAVIQRGETNFPVVVLTAHTLFPEDLKRSFKIGANAYLPKEENARIVPLLEDILRYESLPGLGRVFENLRGFFNGRWRENGHKFETRFWYNFNAKTHSVKNWMS